jgi:thiosulfate/3-mercaptopyruvate sulfurtransferase
MLEKAPLMSVQTKGYAHPEVLVDTDWVQQNLENSTIKLVEVDVDTNAYDEGHITGAIAWNWTTQLSDTVRRDILSREALEALAGQSGISQGDTIVLYGDNNNWFAAFAFWILKVYGHADVRLMDGGRTKWLDEGRTITTQDENPTAVSYAVQEPNPALRSDLREVLSIVGDSNYQLVDIRSTAEFNGDVIAPPGMTETAQRAGHVPGAQSVPWALTVDEDGTFKNFDALQKLYAAKGITGDKPIIAYCRIGERSSHSWFVLKYLLGYSDVKNYDGSWTEYGSVIGVPIER